MLNPPSDVDDNDFVLKHRITGAAFLLFFGALVLPWMLGPPSEAKKTVETVKVETQISEEYVAKELEDEILAQLKENVVDDETVYISRVTPSGFTKVSKESVADEKKQQVSAEKEKTALAEKAEAERVASAKKAQEEKATAAAIAKKTEAEKAEVEKVASAKKAQEEKAKAEAIARENNKKALAPLSEQDRANIAAKQLADALEAESRVTTLAKSGWIVQVGVFTDKAGAKKVSDSLDKSGFKSSSTVVDTNLGIGTGTRVWLGPFSSREEAGKVKQKLADKTGSSGFVRAYP